MTARICCGLKPGLFCEATPLLQDETPCPACTSTNSEFEQFEPSSNSEFEILASFEFELAVQNSNRFELPSNFRRARPWSR